MMENETDPYSCSHVWVTNGGQGGAPSFRAVSVISGKTPVMYVRCERCNARTWFTEERWNALPKAAGRTP